MGTLQSYFSEYKPGKTELNGLQNIAVGIGGLGYGGYLKAWELCTGQKATMDFISGDPCLFYYYASGMLLKAGVKQVLPTVGVVLSVYLIGTKLL